MDDLWEKVGKVLEMLFTMAGQPLDDLVIDGRATAVETETMLGPNAWAKLSIYTYIDI